jgi:hypothetical protein
MPSDESRPGQRDSRTFAIIQVIADVFVIAVLVALAMREQNGIIRAICGAAVAIMLLSWFLRWRRSRSRG